MHTPSFHSTLLAALLAGLCSVPDVDAATYFIRNGGSDEADGLSHDTAWASLGRVHKHEFAPGDRLLFHEEGRWEGQLIVDWPGTEEKRTIIGAYHLDDGVPTWGIRSRRPIIDGGDSIPQQYDGLIRVTADRVRIASLEVVNSAGRAIQFENADHGEVIDCVTRSSYKSGIKLIGSNEALVRGNTVTLAGLAHPLDGGNWGGAIELVASDRGWISANTVTEVHGEGINVNAGSSGAVIERNHVFAARAVGIYLDAAPNATVRRNLIAGTAKPEFWRTHRSSGAGIALNNEKYHYQPSGSLATGVQTHNARIYANLVAYTSSGVGLWGQLDESSFDGVLIFNNTFVDNDTQITAGSKPKPGGRLLNNIMMSLSSGTRDVDTNDLAGMDARGNYFSRGDPGGDYSHAGNVYGGVALARMSGWRSGTRLGDVRPEHFALLPDSPAIGAGVDDPLNLSQENNTFDLDFYEERHTAPMDLGAMRFTLAPRRVPKHPTNISAAP